MVWEEESIAVTEDGDAALALERRAVGDGLWLLRLEVELGARVVRVVCREGAEVGGVGSEDEHVLDAAELRSAGEGLGRWERSGGDRGRSGEIGGDRGRSGGRRGEIAVTELGRGLGEAVGVSSLYRAPFWAYGVGLEGEGGRATWTKTLSSASQWHGASVPAGPA